MCVPWEVGLRKVKILGSSTELFTEVKGGGGGIVINKLQCSGWQLKMNI